MNSRRLMWLVIRPFQRQGTRCNGRTISRLDLRVCDFAYKQRSRRPRALGFTAAAHDRLWPKASERAYPLRRSLSREQRTRLLTLSLSAHDPNRTSKPLLTMRGHRGHNGRGCLVSTRTYARTCTSRALAARPGWSAVVADRRAW